MSDEQYDPSAHTVDDVNEYLTTADDDERGRVLQAERDGKGRTGILEGPHNPPPTQGDGTTPGLNTGKADTLAEAGAKAAEPEGEKYQKGYDGFVPSRDGDNPVDLTLAGVTGQKDA